MHVKPIQRVKDMSPLRAEMPDRWPLFAHFCEGWAAPDASVPANWHPQRFSAVIVILATRDKITRSLCRVDPTKKTIDRSALVFPRRVGGRVRD